MYILECTNLYRLHFFIYYLYIDFYSERSNCEGNVVFILSKSFFIIMYENAYLHKLKDQTLHMS